MNKHLQKIIDEYLDYKIVFQDELTRKTMDIIRFINVWYFYHHILTKTSDNIWFSGKNIINYGLHIRNSNNKYWYVDI
jgi:hypothetical protein